MNNAQNEDFLLDEEYDDKNLIMEEGASDEDEQGMFEHFRMNVDNGQTPLRVDKYMACHLMDTSRHRVQLAIKNGYVRVNDKVAKAIEEGRKASFVLLRRDSVSNRFHYIAISDPQIRNAHDMKRWRQETVPSIMHTASSLPFSILRNASSKRENSQSI